MMPVRLLSRASSAWLGPAPTAVDDLVRHSQLPAAAVLSLLLDLELAGRIETLSGNRVALRHAALP